MAEDETLRALFDTDAPASAPNLSELRSRLLAHIDGSGGIGPQDDGGPPESGGDDGSTTQSGSRTESSKTSAAARTSGPAHGIQGEHEDSTNRGQSDEGQTVTDSDGQGQDYGYDPGGSLPPHIVRQQFISDLTDDIDSAGSDDALERLRQYVLVVDDIDFARGLDDFYRTHDFPEELFGAVRRMQAHRGTSPRRFPTADTFVRTEEPIGRRRVAVSRALIPDPVPLMLDEPTLEPPIRGPSLFSRIGILWFVIVGFAILGLLWFFLFRGGGSDTESVVTSVDTSVVATPPATAEDTVPPDDAEPEAVEDTVPPDGAVTIELTAPLYIVLSDESQYPVWGLGSLDGSVTYVLVVPPRAQGCLLVSFGGNDVDTVGTCDLPQIGTSQPATVLYSADDGSVIIELRNPDVVNLTDEVGFAQSAVVAVRDAPIVDSAEQLLIFGTEFTATG